MAPIRERVSLFSRYNEDVLQKTKPFRTYYLIMEGTNTEPMYFRLLEKEFYENRVRNRFRIVYLERTMNDRGSNTPRQLLTFMKAFRKNKGEDAEYCMVFDRDSFKNHSDPRLSYLNFLKYAKNTKIRLIVSSPCFEIWLLLHKKNAYQDYMIPNRKDIFANPRISSTFTYISKLVYDIFGFNPKSNIPENFTDKLPIARIQSKYLTSNLKDMADDIGENIGEFIEELLKDPRNL